MIAKKELRRSLLARRATLDAAYRAAGARALTDRLMDLPEVQVARTILVYVSVKEEVPTRGWIARWTAERRTVLVPRIEADGLVPCPITCLDDLVEGSHGIPTSPADPWTGPVDLVVAPGAGFSPRCERIGLGKAYYDRLLARIGPWFVCGVGWDEQIVDEVPMEPHDRALDAVVTPTRTFRRPSAEDSA